MSNDLFYLMHKDSIVVTISVDTVNGNINRVSANGVAELLPLGGRKSPDELKKWWARRAVPVSQGDIRRILQAEDIPTTQSLLVQNLGLSLTDHYWIKPIDSNLKWCDVNIYENDFKESIEEWKFSNSAADLRNATTFYPGSSLQGELEKKWIIGPEGERILVKGNYGNSSQQSANEVIATLMHKKQNKFPYVEYKFCKLSTEKENKIGCMCKNFTDINTVFISAYEVINSVKKRNNISDFEHFIEVCGQNGLDAEYVRNFLEYQILTDFVITNTDRHYNNFGILRDSETLEFTDVAPIFDSGNSMFWNNPKMAIHDDLTNIKVSGFRNKEIDLLKYVRNCDNVDMELMPDDSEIGEILSDGGMVNEEIEAVVIGYNKKIKMLREIMLQR